MSRLCPDCPPHPFALLEAEPSTSLPGSAPGKALCSVWRRFLFLLFFRAADSSDSSAKSLMRTHAPPKQTPTASSLPLHAGAVSFCGSICTCHTNHMSHVIRWHALKKSCATTHTSLYTDCICRLELKMSRRNLQSSATASLEL